MTTSLLHEELVFLDYKAQENEELLKNLATILNHKGYVKTSYANAVISRERVFPTGLNTLGVKVAVPHTDPEHVNKAAILVAKLSTPVRFKEMGNSGGDVDVQLLFMLAVTDPKEHLATLSKLMSIFSNGDKLLDLYQSDTKKAIINKLDEILA
ncbi:phosphoenolpyruvate-dependent sugar phosphotransferase system eiia 2 [Lucifera butyrica]|uniref:Phosphoenolpyruvate-dependent sugar phosphotransferase system eiia 2 n=1 Tax=Lucifera butyrica TaxID=1351585 RepID=A0A498R9T7_9FIRM|nr:PTS sugar transporter subunit IIA [Lucifera butyrica]VBB07755.1 phosphoenolpyruvate-dependent sugar phosphotransferase system eiia 2 [Lucifera butyrica]